MSKMEDNIISIPEYFAGQSILITGGTGLMGKVLVEKILRSCPGVEKIYLFIRQKKGVSMEERWQKLTQLALFDRLKRERPGALDKVVLVPGQIQDEEVCPSVEFQKLLEENVTMIYHAAAVVQFNDCITDTLASNVRGTVWLLELARRMSKLKVFIYVSTAYSNFNRPCEESVEKVLPPCQDWKVVLKLLKTDPRSLGTLKEKLMGGHPNPYTWSKSLAEQAVNDYRKYFPVIIMRPGLVSCTLREPFPGWSDGTNGCFSFSAAVALGFLHVYKPALDQYQDLVPVDLAINAFLIAPWKLQVIGSDGTTEVYNCTTASEKIVTYGEMRDIMGEVHLRTPSKNILWAPFAFHVTNPFLHSVVFFFLQILPAALLDIVLMLFKKKPMFIDMNKKVINAYRLSEGIMCNKVMFPNKRFIELETFLKNEDIPAFGYHTESVEPNKELIFKQCEAFYKYYLKEDLSEENLKKNGKRYKRIMFIHKTIVTLGSIFLYWLCFTTATKILGSLLY